MTVCNAQRFLTNLSALKQPPPPSGSLPPAMRGDVLCLVGGVGLAGQNAARCLRRDAHNNTLVILTGNDAIFRLLPAKQLLGPATFQSVVDFQISVDRFIDFSFDENCSDKSRSQNWVTCTRSGTTWLNLYQLDMS